MSWDLYLVPREHADDAGDWMESLVVDGMPPDRAAAREHANVVREQRPELEPWESESDGTFELSAPEASGLPFQVFLDGHHAGIGIAYWEVGDRAGELTDLVVDVASALHEHTGWILFDPQEDREVTLEELRSTFATGFENGVEFAREIAREVGGESGPRRGRFFGLFGRRR